MKYLALIILCSLASCSSQSIKKRDREILLKADPTKTNELSEINTYPEIYLANDSVLEEIDSDDGVVLDAYMTADDSSRISLSVNFSLELQDLVKIQAYDISYSSKLSESYRQYWWSAQFKSVTAKYSAIANESVSNSSTTRSSSNQNFSIAGLGLGHRFRALTSHINSSRVFETVTAFVNYVAHTDTSSSDAYSGVGYTAEYGLHYRGSETFSYGMKFSYNWAMTQRKENEDALVKEDLSDRSLIFGWAMFGFELGYYF